MDDNYQKLQRIFKKIKQKDFDGAALDLCRTTERYAIIRAGQFQIENKDCQETCLNGGKCEEICGDSGYCCSSGKNASVGDCPKGKSDMI